MPRIKVTGYIDTRDIDPEHLDLDHDTGLSSEGFDFMAGQVQMDDLDFALEPE